MAEEQKSFSFLDLTKRQRAEWRHFREAFPHVGVAGVVPLECIRDIKSEYDAAYSFIDANDVPGFSLYWGKEENPQEGGQLRINVCALIDHFEINPPLENYRGNFDSEIRSKMIHLFKLLDPVYAGRKTLPVEKVVRDVRAFLKQNTDLHIERHRGEGHYGLLPQAMREWYKETRINVSASTIRRRLEEAENLNLINLRREFPGFYHHIVGKSR